MTVQTNNNGRVRKSLAEQIDRLDEVIDALGDGLNQAVLTVVEQAVTVAVKEAVQAALKEVLTNPDLRASMTPVAKVAPTPVNPPAPTQMKQDNPTIWERVSQMAQTGWARALEFLGQGWEALTFAWGLACRFRVPMLIASGVGLVAALGCYHAGPVIASAVSGITGFCASLIASLTSRVWNGLEELNAWLLS